MRRFLTAALVVGVLALPNLGAASAAVCDIWTPPAPPYATSVGVATTSPSAGTQRTYACISGLGTYEVMNETTATRSTVGRSEFVVVGEGVRLCNPSSTATRFWTCYAVVDGTTVAAQPGGTDRDLGVTTGAKACEARSSWEREHCVGAGTGVVVDGLGGDHAGVGADAYVCDDHVGMSCPLDDLGVPGRLWLDASPLADIYGENVRIGCSSRIC